LGGVVEETVHMAKKKEEFANEWDQIEIGDQVRHAKWGVGTVLFRSGMGDAAKAIAVFPEEGQKRLMLKFSGLVKVGSTSLKSVEKLKAEAEAEAKPKSRPKPRPKPRPVHEDAAEHVDEEEVDLGLDELEADDEELPPEETEEVAGFNDEEEGFTPKSEKGGEDA
jgi:hypothetical protein